MTTMNYIVAIAVLPLPDSFIAGDVRFIICGSAPE